MTAPCTRTPVNAIGTEEVVGGNKENTTKLSVQVVARTCERFQAGHLALCGCVAGGRVAVDIIEGALEVDLGGRLCDKRTPAKSS